MSKLASKLSRRILAIALSVAMIMPNMTVYASEVSGSDSIVTASEVEADDTSAETVDTVDETDAEEDAAEETVDGAADDEQQSSPEEEIPEDEDETINTEGGDTSEKDDASDTAIPEYSQVVSNETPEGTAAAGKIDFTSGATGDDVTVVTKIEDLPTGISVTDITYHGSHGIVSAANGTMTIKLASKANITVQTCCFNGDKTNMDIMDTTSGRVVPEKEKYGTEAESQKFNVVGATGDVTLTFTKNDTYIHTVTIEYTEDAYYVVTMANDGHGSAKAKPAVAAAGTKITLTPTANSGYAFDKWEVVSGGVTVDANNEFTMPANDVEIKAVFKASGPRKVWDFTSDTSLHGDTGVALQGGTPTGELAGLQIDATAGKFDSKGRTTDAQVNAGAKIKIPVTGVETAAGVKVTVRWYSAGSTYTIADQTFTSKAGNNAPANVDTWEGTGTDGYVEVVLTETDNYLLLIKIDPIVPAGTTDVKDLASGTDLTTYADKGIEIKNIAADGKSHGILAGADATIKLNLSSEKTADVEVLTCRYGSKGITATDSAENSKLKVAKGSVAEGDAPAPLYTLLGAKGDTTLTIGSGTYIHSIKVTYYDTYVDKYTVTVDVKNGAKEEGDNKRTNGTAVADKAYCEATTGTVALTVTPEQGYGSAIKLYETNADGTAGTEIDSVTVSNDNKFTMPAKDVTVEVTFTKIGDYHDITVANAEDATTGTAEAGTQTKAATGTLVYLEDAAKATAAAGNEFKEWQVKDASGTAVTVTKTGGKDSFTMPDANVTITPVFQVKVVKYFKTTYFTLLNKNGISTSGGAVNDIDGLEVLTEGTTKFKYHADHGIDVDVANVKLTLDPTKKYDITIWECQHGSKDIAATSKGQPITVDKSPEKVTNDTDKADDPKAGESTYKFTILNVQEEITLNFSGGQAYLHSIILTESSGVPKYKVTVTADEHGNAKADKTLVEAGTEITLTAEPDSHYKLKEWQVVSGDVTIEDNKFTMPAKNVEVKAIFEPINRRDWDFVNDEELKGDKGKEVTGKTETVAGLSIDATASGSGWDSTGTGTDGAVAKNKTKITVPVDGACKIKVSAGTTDYTVDDTAAATAEETFDCKGKDGKVVIEMTADNHIKSINVTPIYYVKEGTYNFASIKRLIIDGFAFDKIVQAGNSHGCETSAANASMTLNLSGKANITLLSCRYGAVEKGEDIVLTPSSGTVTRRMVNEAGADAPEFRIRNADAGPLTLSFNNQGNIWFHNIEVEYIPEDGQDTYANGIDVWDFGAEQLKSTSTVKYNNRLTEAIINSWYPGVAPGTAGVSLKSFEIRDEKGIVDFKFSDGGYTDTHRLRTSNTKLTRTDEKTLEVGDTTYTGYIYSNKSAEKGVYVGVRLNAGDIMTAVVSSNGNAYTISVEDPSGEPHNFARPAGASIITYYATESGMHKIYNGTDEKLVVARVTRQHSKAVTVSGKVTRVGDVDGSLKLVFTCKESGMVKEAAVEANGSYEVELFENYNYDVIVEPTEYVIKEDEGAKLQLGPANATQTFEHNVTVRASLLRTLSGSIVGLDDDAIAALNIKVNKPADKLYLPKIEIDRTAKTYTAKLENGVEYTMVAEGINDYELDSTANNNSDRIKINSDILGRDITYKKKPVWDVTIEPVGAAEEDLAEATFTFTNINEAGYVYTFKGTTGIQLRDGTYSVVVSDSGDYKQKLTTNLVVNGKEVTKTIEFSSDLTTKWDFTDENNYESGKLKNPCDGLSYTKGKSWSFHDSTYGGRMADLVITVPVSDSTSGNVKVVVGNSWDISDGKNVNELVTGSGAQNTAINIPYSAGTKKVDITVGSGTTTYLKAIEVVTNTEYKSTITVGKNKDCETINAALAAVRSMDRTENGVEKPVTIAIDPGDYEEMLVIDVNNITLKNASATPSIGLRNKGVDIDPNAVRITAYYGHGYTYYSMGSDCKWNEEILATNKANGYPSYVNPGSGSTDGSYWNATVSINASNVSAQGIIFENSFNQYISKKAAEDIIVKQSGAKEGGVLRSTMAVGDTKVQEKEYVERAAALAIYNDCAKIYFDNCKFVGRQDTLYGGTGVTAAFYDCSIYGGTDYIFGGMNAVFAKCDLVFNTNDLSANSKNDIGYITAAQQESGHGYLMYNCHVTSTIPGVDTASQYTSKPGYLGRPWKANTGEALFYKTIIDEADAHWGTKLSLIEPLGWIDTLSGQSELSQEYGTYEVSGAQNQGARAEWATTMTDNPYASDAAAVTEFLGSWTPFTGKDMDIVMPDDDDVSKPAAPTAIVTPEPTEAEGGAKTVITGASIVLSAETGAKVYYNVNADANANPTAANGTLYNGAIKVEGNNIKNDSITIKAIAVKYDQTSEVAEFTYSVEPTPNTEAPVFALATGENVELGDRIIISAAKGAEIHYNVNASDSDVPTASSTLYTGKDGIEITDDLIKQTDSTVTIKAIAVLYGKASTVATATYNVKVNAPTANPKSGYQFPDGGGKVVLTADKNVTILYTMGDDPADPTTATGDALKTYSGDGITVSASTKIKAVAQRGDKYSTVVELEYRVPLSMPTADPESGTPMPYDKSGKVKLDSAETSANIYYTIAKGNNEPENPITASGEDRKTYSRDNSNEGIEITEKTTIKAVAESGGTYSTVAVFIYELENPTPTATPRSGSEFPSTGGKVKLDSPVAGAEIYYTTAKGTADPADPKEQGATHYDKTGDGITITEDTTIKAVAKVGDDYSDVVTFTYTVEIPKPTADPESGKQFPATGGKVKLNSTVDGATIYYTTATNNAIPANPKDPASGRTPYDTTGEGIAITEDTIIRAVVEVGGRYSGVETFSYTVKTSNNSEEDDSGLTAELVEEMPEGGYVYEGRAITPAVIVKNNNIPLTEGTDYTVKYSNNVNISGKKDASITVTGKGSFSGKVVKTFKIVPKNIEDDDIKIGTIKVLKNAKVTPILVYNGVKLAANKDFKFKEGSPIKFAAASADDKVTLVGNGNYTGEIDISVTVVESKADLKPIAVKLNKPSYTYTGSEITPDYTVTSGTGNNKETFDNAEDMDEKFTLAYNSDDRTNVGTVKVTVIGLGDYTGSITKSFKIVPDKTVAIAASLADGDNAAYEYVSTGTTVPADDITVTINNGATELEPGVDYKVTYSGNKKVTNPAKPNTKAKCIINFIGNYKGCAKKTLTFSIYAATISNDTVEVYAPAKIFKKKGVYKSVPSVIYTDEETGVQTLLKKSDYDVKYYLDDSYAADKEMTSRNQLEAAGKVYMTITGKGNYTSPVDENGVVAPATGEYKVCEQGTLKDLSKAKVEIYDLTITKPNKKTTKVEYTGKPITFEAASDDYVSVVDSVTADKIFVAYVADVAKYELRLKVGSGRNTEYVPTEECILDFANNINKGKATVVITAKADSDDYIGGKTATFSIVAQKVKTNLLDKLFGDTTTGNALNVFKRIFN